MKINPSIEIRALGKALMLSLLLGVVAAMVVYFTNLKETMLPLLGRIILAASIFAAACSTTRARGSKGLVRGMNMGLAVFILVFISTLALHPAAIALKTFLYALALCLVAGGLGGIVGVALND
ncbi:MAG TPA: TIGR04086 family membrane protein [Syntrophomonadaceae bacterium]|nr:TIGR04086 family membrane protein [Syntrophomonadaceae bacterium]